MLRIITKTFPTLILALAIGFFHPSLFVSSSEASSPPNRPKLLTYLPTRLFTPDGFDDNDNSQIIVHGDFPNTCYKVGPIESKIDETTKTITITNKAYFYDGCWCLDVLVPFTKVVNLGILNIGQFKIELVPREGDPIEMGTLPIARSTNPGPDDFTYAPIEDVYFKRVDGVETKTLALKGTFETDCMYFRDPPRAQYRPGNVIVILPIVEIGMTGCTSTKIPFEVEVDLLNAPQGENLVHVRSLNGTSINKFVTF